jgi:polyisoprenoid-binding protein YceI
MKVKGKFTDLRGEAHVDPTGIARGQLIVDASSVDTGNQKRDNHLRSDDFFAVGNYPEIIYELSRVAPGSEYSRLSGSLSVIGNTHPLDLLVQVRDHDASGLTLQVDTTVDRSRWGIIYRKSGMVKMGTGLEIVARFNRKG